MNTVELHYGLTDSLSRIELSFAGHEINLVDFAPDFTDFKEGCFDADEFIDAIEHEINHTEVIYFHRAMEILSEHDQSLSESLEIADDYGYKVSDLNSEILASFLVQKELREQLHEVWDEIIQAFDYAHFEFMKTVE